MAQRENNATKWLSCAVALGFTLSCGLATAQIPENAAVLSQNPDGVERKISEIARASTPPVLDGVLDDAVWADAGGIPGHHILFSANPDKTAVFMRSGRAMIPLEFPSEPLLDYVNAINDE